jgi:hypothetical protein
MRTRRGNPTRIAGIVVAVAMACLSVGVGQRGNAEECGYVDGQAWNCPSPEPLLETYGGSSLYWHDPCCEPRRCYHRRDYCHPAASPRCYVMTEFLPLYRDQSGSTVFQAVASLGEEDGEAVVMRRAALSSSDFDAEFDPGMRVLIGYCLGDWYRLEFSYFGSYSWADAEAIRDEADGLGNLLSPFSNFGDASGMPGLDPLPVVDFDPIVGLDFNELASIRFSSRLNNAELNIRRRLCTPTRRFCRAEASWLVGLRYMKIKENFGYFTESFEATNTVNVNTDNDMFGVQIGALTQILVHDRAWVDVQIKGAILFNRAHQRTVYTGTVFAPGGSLTADTEDRTSFLGDLSVIFNYQFAPAWTFRVGYNAIWLEGVALATENFSSDINTLVDGPAATVNHDGRVVYHGPSIGVVWTR